MRHYVVGCLLLLCCIALMPLRVVAQANVSELSYKREGANEYLTIYSTKPLKQQKTFVLKSPARLVIDIDRVGNDTFKAPSLEADALASTIRFGHFDEDTSRFVLELKKDAPKYTIHTFSASDGQPYRLVLHLQSSESFVDVARVTQKDLEDVGFVPIPVRKPAFFSRENHHKPLIVIDAGHGGKDPGAIGTSGTREKDITITYATSLRRALLRTGQYNVAMTRSDDTFIFLHERVRMARKAGGDLFISLHADSAPKSSARGVSVYTVSEKASDKEAATLAQKENEADKIGGIGFAEEYPDVADILIDLATRDTRIKSNDFAQSLVKQFQQTNIRLLKNPSRYAGFRVLKAPDIPSVLVEMGFLSNSHDERLLQNSQYRERVITSMVRGVDQYFKNHPVQRRP